LIGIAQDTSALPDRASFAPGCRCLFHSRIDEINIEKITFINLISVGRLDVAQIERSAPIACAPAG
jgi:hypothetical protein